MVEPPLTAKATGPESSVRRAKKTQAPNRTRCMMRPGTSVKIPAIDQGAAEQPEHRELMAAHAMHARKIDRRRKHQQNHDREQMDGAPRSPDPRLSP